MTRNLVSKLAAIVLACVMQSAPGVRAESMTKVVASETTKIVWVWTPEYARRFDLPEGESKLKEGAIKAIGLRISRVETVKQPVRYWCSVELITDGTQDFYFHGMPSHSNQPYENVDLMPGLISLNADEKVANKARLEGRELPAYLRFMHAEKKKDRFISTQYRLFRKEYLWGLQYISLSTGCFYELPQDGFRHVLFIAHANYQGKGWVHEDPKSYRIEIPDVLLHTMKSDLENAIKTNTKYVKSLDKRSRKAKE